MKSKARAKAHGNFQNWSLKKRVTKDLIENCKNSSMGKVNKVQFGKNTMRHKLANTYNIDMCQALSFKLF